HDDLFLGDLAGRKFFAGQEHVGTQFNRTTKTGEPAHFDEDVVRWRFISITQRIISGVTERGERQSEPEPAIGGSITAGDNFINVVVAFKQSRVMSGEGDSAGSPFFQFAENRSAHEIITNAAGPNKKLARETQ